MRFRRAGALVAGAVLSLGVAPCAIAAQSSSGSGVSGPNLVLTNADGECPAGGACNTYTLNSGDEIQVNLTATNGYWTQLPASTDSSVVALESESSDASGDATALFKVVGAGSADLTAGMTACPNPPPAGQQCSTAVQPWEVAIVGKLAAAMAMTASPTTTVYGQPVTLTATFATAAGQTPVPTGNVTFYDGATAIGQAPLTNMGSGGDQATLTVSTLSGGTHELSAVYAGDQTFSGSNTMPVLVTVNPAPTRVAATPALADLSGAGVYAFSLSATLTRSDTAAPLAGQQINFSAGSTPLCTATTDSRGVATCDALTEAPAILASQGYTAAFPGGADYRPSSAPAGLTS